jgi:hypothetical protein
VTCRLGTPLCYVEGCITGRAGSLRHTQASQLQPSMSDAANGPDWAIGCTVSLKTASNEVRACRASSPLPVPGSEAPPCTVQEVKGTVFGYDAATDTLILREQGSHGGVCNLRLLKASFVQVGGCGGTSPGGTLPSAAAPQMSRTCMLAAKGTL